MAVYPGGVYRLVYPGWCIAQYTPGGIPWISPYLPSSQNRQTSQKTGSFVKTGSFSSFFVKEPSKLSKLVLSPLSVKTIKKETVKTVLFFCYFLTVLGRKRRVLRVF